MSQFIIGAKLISKVLANRIRTRLSLIFRNQTAWVDKKFISIGC